MRIFDNSPSQDMVEDSAMKGHPSNIGLFLGAGASAELGMPLVWELTEDLKRWLTPEKLRTFNEGWHLQGGGKSDTVIEDFLSVWTRPEMHYEAVLGYLETQFHRPSPLRAEYQHLYSWLVEMVYHLLLIRHKELAKMIGSNIKLLEGIAKLAEANAPLWVFSLNHDVIVECVAAHYGIPVHSGYTDGIISFPRRDDTGRKIGDLTAESLTAAQLEAGMIFPPSGTSGINLLKIHGALDVFTFRNGHDIARLLPPQQSVAGVIEMLRIANEELPCAASRSANPVRPTNEIAYTDEAGEMQFLRRSLLAGAYKFDNVQSQVLPKHVLTQFQSNIDKVTRLICIGYGFGDLHINEIFRSWLEGHPVRHLVIVSPRSTQVPPFLTHLSKQVSLAAENASSYLDRITGIVRSSHELLEKRLLDWVYKSRRSSQAKQILEDFRRDWQSSWVERLKENLAKLPMRDGDLDCEALGQSPDALARDFAHEHEAEYDFALSAFLAENEGKVFS
jgi:hypothetical protein